MPWQGVGEDRAGQSHIIPGHRWKCRYWAATSQQNNTVFSLSNNLVIMNTIQSTPHSYHPYHVSMKVWYFPVYSGHWTGIRLVLFVISIRILRWKLKWNNSTIRYEKCLERNVRCRAGVRCGVDWGAGEKSVKNCDVFLLTPHPTRLPSLRHPVHIIITL